MAIYTRNEIKIIASDDTMQLTSIIPITITERCYACNAKAAAVMARFLSSETGLRINLVLCFRCAAIARIWPDEIIGQIMRKEG